MLRISTACKVCMLLICRDHFYHLHYTSIYLTFSRSSSLCNLCTRVLESSKVASAYFCIFLLFVEWLILYEHSTFFSSILRLFILHHEPINAHRLFANIVGKADTAFFNPIQASKIIMLIMFENIPVLENSCKLCINTTVRNHEIQKRTWKIKSWSTRKD